MAFGVNDDIVAVQKPAVFGAKDDPVGASPIAPRRAQGMREAFIAGMQDSATGLAARGKLPDARIDKDSPWYDRFAAGVGGVVADLPLSVVGAVGGVIAGGAAGTAVPVVGNAAGALIGGGAGGMGAPMAVRDALTEMYSNNHALDFKGAWEVLKAGAIGGAKGALIGGVTAGVGGKAAQALGKTTSAVGPVVPAIQGATARGTAVTVAELAALTTTASALEGQMPTWQNFLDNALLLGGQKAAVAIARGAAAKPAEKTPAQVANALQHIYAETGKTPDVVAGEAARSPSLRAEITGRPNFQGHTVERMQAEMASRHPGVTFTIGKDADGPVVLELIEAKVPRQGAGTKAMTEFVRYLDENHQESSLIATAIGDTPMSKLVEFYERFGYKVDAQKYDYQGGGTIMHRLPNKEILLEQGTDRPGAARTTQARDSGIQEAGAGDPIPAAYRDAAIRERTAAALGSDPRTEVIRRSLADQNELAVTGQSVVRDPTKYDYITDRETTRNVLQAVAAEYQAEIAAQTRGVVSDAQTRADGLKLVRRGDLPERAVGTAANSAELYARAHMLKGAAAHAVDTINRYNEIPPAQRSVADKLEVRASLERLAMFNAEFSGVAAEAGRALHALRSIKRDPSYLGDAKLLLAQAERAASIDEIAGMLRDAKGKTPAEMATLADALTKATTTEKVMEAWRASILSGPQTHLANIMGNATKWAVDLPERALAASLMQAGFIARGEAPLTVQQFKARALAPVLGVQHGAVDAIKVAAEVWRQKGEHLEKADQYRAAIEGKTGEVVRLPFRFLQVEDALFRTVAERSKAYEMAVDRAVKDGIDPRTREWHEAVQNWMQNPDSGLTPEAGLKAVEAIQNAGAEAVFSQRLGPFLESTQAAIAQHAPALGFIVPFIRTPANLVSWAMQHAPGINMLSKRWRDDYAAGGERRAQATARVIIGAGLMATAYALSERGLLTGSGQFDKEEGGTKRGAGWQPYSLKIDGEYYSIQRMEPVAKVLGVAADIVELSREVKDPDDSAKLALMAVGLFGNATVSTTYLSGLSNAIQSVTDPTRYAPNFFEQYATSLVPKIVGQTTAMFDPHKREVDGAVDAVASQLPYFRQKLLPKIDVWGEMSKNERLLKVLPIATSKAATDKVKTEAVRLEFAISDAPKFLFEEGPFNSKDKRVKLTPEQRNVMREVTGKEAMSILAPIVNAPDWNKIPDFAQVQIYREVFNNAKEMAALKALPPDAPERETLRQKIIDKVMQQSDAAERR